MAKSEKKLRVSAASTTRGLGMLEPVAAKPGRRSRARLPEIENEVEDEPERPTPERPPAAGGLTEEEQTIVDELIAKGKTQGYLTQEDIRSAFPEAESNLEQLEELYIVLFD